MKTLLFSVLFSIALLAQQPAGDIGRVEIPGIKGVLEINVGPSPWYLEFVPEDHWSMLHARQRPDHITLTAQLRQVTFAATPDSCKHEFWPKMSESLAGKADNLRENSYGGALRVEYDSTDQGAQTHHVLAYVGARDLCVEVRLNKVGFTPQDQPAFDQVLGSVRLFPDESGLLPAGQKAGSSSAMMAQGNELYSQADYRSALKLYQDAFALEKQNRTFDKDQFLDLISRLAFCYRLNGNLAKSRETLDFGLSQDAEYPIFHYDMACIYAQMNDVDQSLGHLRQAYKYKDNASPGQMPPDPSEDNCFQKIANDPRFTDAVQKLVPQ